MQNDPASSPGRYFYYCPLFTVFRFASASARILT